MATSSLMRINNDFSTNMHASKLQEYDLTNIARHPDLFFNDGNIAILTRQYYFLVHQGVLERHSSTLADIMKTCQDESMGMIENCPVLQLQDAPEDMILLLQALYDGVSHMVYDATNFSAVSGLLRLLTKYQVIRLREEIIRGLSCSWPSALTQWDARETSATDFNGIYAPRLVLPHPILIINLAHEVGIVELLVSALYDISRSPPSQVVAGYTSPSTRETHHLSESDLMSILQGREHASRFLSTFIVNELEGREPSKYCIYRNEEELVRRRACQIAFEAITFELLRDVNGIVCNRNSDPLYAIQDSEIMQTRADAPGTENKAPYRSCEACRFEYSAVVDGAREEFWMSLPAWYGVEIENWG